MTEEEKVEVIRRLEERYGNDLPNPENQPRVFEYLVKIYLYDLRRPT